MKTFDKKIDIEEISYLYKTPHRGKCYVCGILTYYIDISIGCCICSEKCFRELNDGLFEAVNKGRD